MSLAIFYNSNSDALDGCNLPQVERNIFYEILNKY
jgi:hypothetical protein